MYEARNIEYKKDENTKTLTIEHFAALCRHLKTIIEPIEAYAARNHVPTKNLITLKNDVEDNIQRILEINNFDILDYTVKQFNKCTITPLNTKPEALLLRIQKIFQFDNTLYPHDQTSPNILMKLFNFLQNKNFLPVEILSNIVIPHAIVQLAKKHLDLKISEIKKSMINSTVNFFSNAKIKNCHKTFHKSIQPGYAYSITTYKK